MKGATKNGWIWFFYNGGSLRDNGFMMVKAEDEENFALSRTVIKGTITSNKSSVPHFGTQYVDSYDQTDTVEYVAFIYGRVQTGCQKRSKLFL